MSYIELFVIAVGLSMDAFAVSIGKGMSMKVLQRKQQWIVGLWFGGFQALMPIIGYFVGINFRQLVQNLDHWIAFVLLMFIGLQMLKESQHEDEIDASMQVKKMLLLAIATSIDALAVGVSFAFLPNVNIWSAAGFIGIITLLLSVAGVKIGNICGNRFRSKASIVGGIILIVMGTKILVEHLIGKG